LLCIFAKAKPAAMDAADVCVIIDGVAIRAANNVSESYNALLHELRCRGAVVVPAADFVQCTASTYAAVVWLEPALTPAALSPLVVRRVKALTDQRARRGAPQLVMLVIADDVYLLRGAARAAQQLGDVAGVRVALWTMFPRECYADADADVSASALRRFDHRVWPHVAAPVWFLDPEPGPQPGPRPCIVMYGQRDAARYPERAALAAAAQSGAVWCGDAPDYAARGRVPPATMRDVARAAGAVFVGGGERHAPVAKHVEFAAAGVRVIYTDAATADAVARTFGVRCAVLPECARGAELLVRDAVLRSISAAEDDVADTVAFVRAAHTPRVRVAVLLEWLRCHSSSSSLAPSSSSSSWSASASSSSSLPPAPAPAPARGRDAV
jgi:hypothetical protein